jgi:hypothetical protein
LNKVPLTKDEDDKKESKKKNAYEVGKGQLYQ